MIDRLRLVASTNARRVGRALVLAVVGLVPAVVACDDASTVNGVTDVTASDTAVSSPCDDVACPAPEARCSDDMTGVLTGAPGACEVVDGAPVCSYPDPSVGEVCDATIGVCRAGVCDATEDLCNWRFGPRLSFVNGFALGDQSDDVDPATGKAIDRCCFDLTGDGVVDDRLGEVFHQLRDALIDVNEYFAGQIADGHFNLLFDYEGLDALVDDPWFQLTVFESYPEPNDPDSPMSGDGSFRVKRRSWLEGTHVPRLHTTGRLEGGHFTMDKGTFAFFFATPTGDGVVQLPFTSFRFEGDLTVGPNGQGLVMSGPDGVDGRGARLGGIVPFNDLLTVLNNEVAFSCACATYPEGKDPLDLVTHHCNAPETSTCTEEQDGRFCQVLTGELCPIVFNLFQPDVDLDGDGARDAFTAGVVIKTTSAVVSQGDFCSGPPTR